MTSREISKVVAVQSLESVKEVMSHLQRWSVSLEERSLDRPPQLSSYYSQVRRLKDYLERAMAAYSDPIKLEASEEDENLLVACCIHSVRGLAVQLLVTKNMPQKDQDWLQGKKQSLADLAIECATQPVKEIPSPGHGQVYNEEVAKLLRSIQAKLSGEKVTASQPTHQIEKTASLPQEDWQGGWEGKRNLLPGAEAEPQAKQAPVGRFTAAEFGRTASIVTEQPVHQAPVQPIATLQLNTRMISDPRLRSMVGMDIRSLDRAMAGRDHRMAAVHLASIFEAVLVDAGLARRAELGLKGTPETWAMDVVAKALLGESYSSIDRGSMFHLLGCRNLLRPSIQLFNPLVVTAPTIAKMVAFMHAVLRELGLAGSAEA